MNNRLSEIAQAGAAAQQQAIDNLGGIHGRLVGSRAYTSSGTYVPVRALNMHASPSQVVAVRVRGRRAGGYRGAGGGAGGTAIKYLALTAGSYQVNVGEGGKSGNAGGTSSFGTLVSATGGSGALVPLVVMVVKGLAVISILLAALEMTLLEITPVQLVAVALAMVVLLTGAEV